MVAVHACRPTMPLRFLRGPATPPGQAGLLSRPGVPPLVASLLLVSAGVGAFVLIAMATVALVPLLFGLGFLAALLLAGVLCAWAGVEGLAALERWMESDPRFRR